MVVDVHTEPAFRPGAQRVRLDAERLEGYLEEFDVAPDGERFLLVEDSALNRENGLVVVLNWLEELNRLVPFD